MSTLGEMGEDAVVAKLVAGMPQGSDVVVGPGDDCAVVDVGDVDRYQLLKTDCLVEGVHYLAGERAERVGWKAVARVVSDFAAMGGFPAQLVVTVAVPAAMEMEWLQGLYRGMERCGGQYGAGICGGETSSVPEGSAAVISVAGTGWVDKKRLVTRAGGCVGDVVLVTGRLGGSIAGKHLDFLPRVREAGWLAEHYKPKAMMDLSDGVGKDLPRMAAASGCGYRVFEERVPVTDGCDVRQALGDGEDYELMFAVAPGVVDDLLDQWQPAFPELELTVIGELCGEGQGDDESAAGWEHFSQ